MVLKVRSGLFRVAEIAIHTPHNAITVFLYRFKSCVGNLFKWLYSKYQQLKDSYVKLDLIWPRLAKLRNQTCVEEFILKLKDPTAKMFFFSCDIYDAILFQHQISREQKS